MTWHSIQFTAPIAPVAKGRGRAFRVGNRVVVATPAKTRLWEQQFAALAEAHAPTTPIDEPIAVSLRFVLPRPAAMCSRKAEPGLVPAAKRPDVDNYAKAAMDALKGWWVDDARVVSLQASKWYAELGGSTRVEVSIWPLRDGEVVL